MTNISGIVNQMPIFENTSATGGHGRMMGHRFAEDKIYFI